MLQDALSILAERKFSELPVVDGDRHAAGRSDIDSISLAGNTVAAAPTEEDARGACLTLHRESAPRIPPMMKTLEDRLQAVQLVLSDR